MRQTMRYCSVCKRATLHIGVDTSHVLHLLLSLITLGLWVPFWILTWKSNSMQHACTQCGKSTSWGR